MSYCDTDPGELEIQAGIEKVLDDVELRYVYLDTIKHPGEKPKSRKRPMNCISSINPMLS